jgi:hypothetical protein
MVLVEALELFFEGEGFGFNPGGRRLRAFGEEVDEMS